MITPSLINYIEQSLAAGKSKEQIVSDLRLAGGWAQADIDEAFLVLQKPPYKQTTKSKARSFFVDIIVVLVILGALAFAAEKFDAPLVNNLVSNIAGVLTHKDTQQPAPAPTNAIPASAAQDTTVDDSNMQSAQTTDTSMDASSTTSSFASTTTTPPALVTCANNDSNCLIQSASVCAPVTEQNTTKTSKDISTRFYAVIGQQNNECVFSFNVKSDSVKATVGKGGLCNFSSPTDLTTVLTDWAAGNFSVDNTILANECTGSYFNK